MDQGRTSMTAVDPSEMHATRGWYSGPSPCGRMPAPASTRWVLTAEVAPTTVNTAPDGEQERMRAAYDAQPTYSLTRQWLGRCSGAYLDGGESRRVLLKTRRIYL